MNHLAHETSPYLLQHQHNPVDWHPWGKDALEKARREDKPIFLSIGYAACHWCHVMEHESFEDKAIAKLMNERFVNIKVDREERPDLDEIYMTAVQALTGRGGWPMSVWLTPSLEPIFAGTYFPPADKYGVPGFTRVIEHVDRIYKEQRENVGKGSKSLAEGIAQHLAPKLAPGEPELGFADAAVELSRKRFDHEHGGWGDAPKFPHASELMLLLRHHARTQEPDSLRMAVLTLEKMAKGGMYDQLGGGFHRYSTDRIWLVPHFEKMLYDNALLARVYVEAFTLTKEPLFARIARETLDWMLREMQHAEGGFFATQDADSEGEEGKFFVWQQAELDALAEEDRKLLVSHFGISEHGNWEHKNVLQVVKTAKELGVSDERLRRAKDALLLLREKRVHPATDDKVLAAWNGMAIAACALGYQALGDERYLAAAQKAAGFVLAKMRDPRGRLLRSWRNGEAKLAAYLEDYAFLADALLTLFESDFDPRWLKESQALCATMKDHFLDAESGAFYFTADDHEQLIARSKSAIESSQPSGQAMAAIAFLRLGLLRGDAATYDLGVNALRANHEIMQKYPAGCPALFVALELHSGDPKELVIAGEREDAQVQAFLARARDVPAAPRDRARDARDREAARDARARARRQGAEGRQGRGLCVQARRVRRAGHRSRRAAAALVTHFAGNSRSASFV